MEGDRFTCQAHDVRGIPEDFDPCPSDRADVDPLEEQISRLLVPQPLLPRRIVVLHHAVDFTCEARCEEEIQASFMT